VMENGVPVNTIDYYAPANHIYNVESLVLENMSLGWHSLLFDHNNMEKGQSESDNYQGYLLDFIFRPTKPNQDTSYNYQGGSSQIIERFTSIIDGTIKVVSPSSSGWKVSMLKSSPSTCLKPGKKL